MLVQEGVECGGAWMIAVLYHCGLHGSGRTRVLCCS